MPTFGPAPLLGRPITITGLGAYAPPKVLTNFDLMATLDTSDEWIVKRTGIKERRIADPGVNTSDLAIQASRAALEDAGLAARNIDFVITATVTPDRHMPAVASRIGHELGCVDAGACDVSAGCAGFLYALAMGSSLVASGVKEHALVIGAETLSRITDWDDRSTAVLFGDGAGAAVVSPRRGDGGPRGILAFDLGGDGSGGDLLMVPAGGSALPASLETVKARQHFIFMNGPEVYKFATRVVPESAKRVLDACGREVSEVDLFVPHQANLRIIEGAVKKLGIAEDKVYTNLRDYGNTSSASIPLCLSEARDQGRLKDGDLVLLMGFGAGLTWGACLIEWGGGRDDSGVIRA